MTTKKYPTDDLSKYANYQLCYVEEIPTTYNDYTEETKAMMETPEFKEYREKKDAWYKEWFKEHHSMTFDNSEHWDKVNGYNWKLEWKDYPTPDYKAGYTHYLYFTNDMSKQWGDDWDDAPYEHNAEVPYDDETDIIMIPINLYYGSECYVYFPEDYGNGNSPFSVDLINAGAIPWIFMYINEHKAIPKSVSIMAGESPVKVITKLKEFENDCKRENNEKA